MNLKKLIVTYILILFTCSLLMGQEPTVQDLALKGIDVASSLKYKEAADIFDEIIRREPKNPQGYFLRSAVYFWMFSEDSKNPKIGI